MRIYFFYILDVIVLPNKWLASIFTCSKAFLSLFLSLLFYKCWLCFLIILFTLVMSVVMFRSYFTYLSSLLFLVNLARFGLFKDHLHIRPFFCSSFYAFPLWYSLCPTSQSLGLVCLFLIFRLDFWFDSFFSFIYFF